MQLTVWKDDFGLPSLDCKCLAAMAFSRFAKLPIDFVISGNPWRSATGQLPILKDNGSKISGFQEVFNHLKEESNLDASLTAKERSVTTAYMALIEERLSPALDHYIWVDSQNFGDFTRPWYAKSLIFPLSLFLPAQQSNHVIKRLFYSNGAKFLSEKDKEYKIYKDAKECINLLSNILGNNDYFFGSQPSSFDAVVFGYLAVLEKAPFKNKSLQQHIKQCTNLSRYCQQIMSKWFPLSINENEIRNNSKETPDEEFPNKMRNGILAGTLALMAMISYAFLSGMLQLEFVENDDEDSENDNDNQTEN